jgi:hypothetical protein
MGGNLKARTYDAPTSARTPSPVAKNTVNNAAQYYPTDWVEALTEQRTIYVGRGLNMGKAAGDCGTARPGEIHIRMTKPRNASNAAHEIGHAFEATQLDEADSGNILAAYEQAFLERRRVLNPDGTPTPLEGSGESFYMDGEFPRYYTGRRYTNPGGLEDGYEAFTTGIQALYYPDWTRVDEDLLRFVIGALTVL